MTSFNLLQSIGDLDAGTVRGWPVLSSDEQRRAERAAWLWLRSCRRIEAYDGLVRGELEYVMSASTSMPSPHCIGILMSAAGRFLVCRACQLRLEFPAGAHYDTIAKEFESHCCSSPIPSKDNAA